MTKSRIATRTPDESTSTKKNKKKKTCLYYGKVGHIEISCWNKTKYFEEEAKSLEGDMEVVQSAI